MPHPRFTNEEIARRGEEIYAARLRGVLGKEHQSEAKPEQSRELAVASA